MKLAVLYAELSGYVVGCLEALRSSTECSLFIIAKPAVKDAPFASDSLYRAGRVLDRSTLGELEILEQLREFGPNAVLVSGWADPVYNRICRRLKATGVPVIAGCDTQWKGSLRQRLASLVAPWHVHRFIDVLWVTGERQRQLARALGFLGNRCWDGFYACDWERFSKNSEKLKAETLKPKSTSPQSSSQGGEEGTEPVPYFHFVGRYVEEKGIEDLAEAYQIYRHQVSNPWPLVCAGKGELRSVLIRAGAEDRGFVQPDDLPELMHRASAFVLSSRFEPWGVVVQEAAAARLPLIVTEACGAGVHLVRENYNGFVAETQHPKSLAAVLIRMHRLSAKERQEFGVRSWELSKQYTPERWATTLREGLLSLHERLPQSVCVEASVVTNAKQSDFGRAVIRE